MLSMSKQFNKAPSDILGIDDTYTAYCFDEACMFILGRLQDGEKPHYKIKGETEHFASFSDMYKMYR